VTPLARTAVWTEPSPVPDAIAALPNVDRIDERTWEVTIKISDQVMRRMVDGRSLQAGRISLVQVYDRLELTVEG
jgi:hypothetical protein